MSSTGGISIYGHDYIHASNNCKSCAEPESASYRSARVALKGFRDSLEASRYPRLISLEDLFFAIGGATSGLKHIAHLRNTIDKYQHDLQKSVGEFVIHEMSDGTVYQFNRG